MSSNGVLFPTFGHKFLLSGIYICIVFPLCLTFKKYIWKACVIYDDNHRPYLVSVEKPCHGVPGTDFVGADKAEHCVEFFSMLPASGSYCLMHKTFPI